MNIKHMKRTALVLHFLFVILTISQVYKLVDTKPLEDVLNIYSSFTYANRDFGFFAPTVNDDMFMTIQAHQGVNDSSGYRFEPPISNDENKIRYLTMLWHFGEGLNATRMDLYARSWSVYCMNRDTSITKVIITVNQNHIPTMGEYSNGKRITNDLYYQTTFYAK